MDGVCAICKCATDTQKKKQENAMISELSQIANRRVITYFIHLS